MPIPWPLSGRFFQGFFREERVKNPHRDRSVHRDQADQAEAAPERRPGARTADAVQQRRRQDNDHRQKRVGNHLELRVYRRPLEDPASEEQGSQCDQQHVQEQRRPDGQDVPGEALVYDDGRLLIDLDKRYVALRGKPVQLTPTEFRLLSTLMRNVGRVVSHEELIREVWGLEESASLASLKVYIHYLRRKIEDHPREPYYLLAEWGIGYRFREQNPVSALNN